MLKLYNAPHSTCSQKVRICLAEKGLPFEDIRLDLGKGKDQLKPEYLKLNPNGVVPTLVDDGDVIIDSSVICEYLDEKYSEPKLAPEDVVQRAKMRAWMRYLEEVPTAAVRSPLSTWAFCPASSASTSSASEPSNPTSARSANISIAAWDQPASSAPRSRRRSIRSPAPARAWTRRWPVGPG
jgi:glutathione S-transferase